MLEFVEKLEGMIDIDSTYIGLVIKMVGMLYQAQDSLKILTHRMILDNIVDPER